MTALLVALGAAVGAPLRYLADRWLHPREGVFLPRGTLLVNVIGSFLLGAVASAFGRGSLGPDTVALVGTGFCGALTTYSTFGYESVRLVERAAYRLAALYVVSSVALGLCAAGLGWWLGTAL